MKIKVGRQVVHTGLRGFVTRTLFASDPDSIAAHPEQVWTTADGRKMLVCDMETKHIYNAMRLIVSRAAQQKLFLGLSQDITPEQVAEKIAPIYKVMREEIKRRFIPEAPEAPETKQPRRKIRLEGTPNENRDNEDFGKRRTV